MKRSRLYRIGIVASSLTVVLVVALASRNTSVVAIDPFYPVDGEVFQSGVIYEPFTAALPLPAVKEAGAPFAFQCTLPQIPGQLPPKFYQVRIKRGEAEIVPGVKTEIWGYDGMYPGPTFRAFHNEPAVIRFHNELDRLTIVHQHGAHLIARSDGNPSIMSQLITPGEFRDFCYPNNAPLDPVTGQEDMSDFPSTMWYHDHAHEPGSPRGITGENVYHGLAGFYINMDELEQGLIERNVLPGGKFDVPMVIQDRTISADGKLVYNPEAVDFNGVLGDIPVVNGKAQPFFEVERRKYRFRILNGSTARFIQLRLSTGEPFLQVGADTWLLGRAVFATASSEDGTSFGEIRLGNAERADLIVDFTNAPDEVFLENVLTQSSGRKPDKVESPGTPLVKFVVKDAQTSTPEATVVEGTELREHRPIDPKEISVTREFVFERTNGRWAINGEFFDHHRVDANPTIGTAERWIIRNGGGGWAHPIHIHDEAHQIMSIKGRNRDNGEMFKKDTVRLDPGVEVEVFFKFRTFPGKFVFHCHNNEHEDDAMMFRFDVVETPGARESLESDIAMIRPGVALPVFRGSQISTAVAAMTGANANGAVLFDTPPTQAEKLGIQAQVAEEIRIGVEEEVAKEQFATQPIIIDFTNPVAEPAKDSAAVLPDTTLEHPQAETVASAGVETTSVDGI